MTDNIKFREIVKDLGNSTLEIYVTTSDFIIRNNKQNVKDY